MPLPDNKTCELEYLRAASLQRAQGPWPKPKYVPKKILVTKTIRGLSLPGEPRKVAKPGEYNAYSNPLGACSVMVDLGLLGVKPGEFEVLEWQENPHLKEEKRKSGD